MIVRFIRVPAFGLATALFVMLAACQSALDIGAGGGDPVSGATYLSQIRSEYGLQPLRSDPTLEKAALEQATYMARSGRMEHTTRWHRDFAARIRDNGIPAPAAENIAWGRMDPAELFRRWMASPGHRENILNPDYSRFGLAYVYEAGGERRYWALILA